MCESYLLRGGKVVTVSTRGTIHDGGILVQDGKITAIDDWRSLRETHPNVSVIDHSDAVITPSLVDCHTHLLEFAPTSLHPVTSHTHFAAGQAILLNALASGITAVGEQICGHPFSYFSTDEYRHSAADFPMDISFAATSITIGFNKLAHFSAITQSQPISQKDLCDSNIVKDLARQSDYPGENIFINATPANFKTADVPRAGEIVYSFNELKNIAAIYHKNNKMMGAHVAGEEGIQMALDAGIDVLHHAHSITDQQIRQAAKQNLSIIATPMGGTHLQPNSPATLLKLIDNNIPVSIATDAYLPPYPDIPWLAIDKQTQQGPDVLMAIAQPIMQQLQANGYEENDLLALLTKNPATILGKGKQFGSLEEGKEANILVGEGVPGLEMTDVSNIQEVFLRGRSVIQRD